MSARIQAAAFEAFALIETESFGICHLAEILHVVLVAQQMRLIATRASAIRHGNNPPDDIDFSPTITRLWDITRYRDPCHIDGTTPELVHALINVFEYPMVSYLPPDVVDRALDVAAHTRRVMPEPPAVAEVDTLFA